jgi:hypothetical protein
MALKKRYFANPNACLARDKSGVAAVEFLFAAPAFFILVFFVVEMALVWNDRHVMRLAAYRAARSVIKMGKVAGPNAKYCWHTGGSGQSMDERSQNLQSAARRASAKVMSVITPTAEQMTELLRVPRMGGVGIGDTLNRALQEGVATGFGAVSELVEGNAYGHALYRMMSGLPSAWILSEVTCDDIVYGATAASNETKGVEIKLTYHRPAKMPYIGTIMWTLYWLQEVGQRIGFTDTGTNGVIRFDPLNYGLGFDVRASHEEVELALERLRNHLTELARSLGQATENKVRNSGAPGAGNVASVGLPEIFESRAGSAFDRGVKEASKWISIDLVNSIGNLGIEMLLESPDLLKTIPVKVSVRVPHYGHAYRNQGVPWNGKAFLAGKFSDQGKNVEKLARKLPEVMVESDPPNDARGLPYVRERQ